MRTISKRIVNYDDILLLILLSCCNILMLHKVVAEQETESSSLLSFLRRGGNNKSPNLLTEIINNFENELINQYDNNYDEEETVHVQTIQTSTTSSSNNTNMNYINMILNKNVHNVKNINESQVYIPQQFINDDEIFSISNPVPRYPRWEFGKFNTSTSSTFVTDNSISIMDSLIDFINMQQNVFNESINIDSSTLFWTENNTIRTSDHQTGANHHYPENLYIVDGNNKTVYTSNKAKYMNKVNHKLAHNRAEKFMLNAMNILYNPENINIVKENWPRLHELLIIDKKSFPFISQYSDYVGCNYHNWNNGKESIPLFTLDAQNRNCNHTIPFPCYYMIKAKDNSKDWTKQIKLWKKQYPKFSEKKSQAVWRGMLSGTMNSDINNRGPRWFLTKLVHDNNTLSQSEMELFNVKLTNVPKMYQRHDYLLFDQLGTISKDNYIKQEDFQNYKAIIDVDGHAWSSRTATLLCYNSVILKIDPQYVDYYYYPRLTKRNENKKYNTLQPWIHYIPVKIDSSDLIEKTQYVMDNNNEKHIQQIISNANQWCIENFIKESVANDVLDIWEEYIKILDKSTYIKNELLFLNGNDILLQKQKYQQQERKNDNEIDDWESQWNEMYNEVMNGPLDMASIVTTIS